MKLAFIFRTAPHGRSISREGLDALLAATAFCDETDIGAFFVEDGILNLLSNQEPTAILQKDVAKMFKLLDLYDIEQRFICADSLAQFSLRADELVLACQVLSRSEWMAQLQQAEKIFTF
jgi:sulfur relay protein tusC/dsrF